VRNDHDRGHVGATGSLPDPKRMLRHSGPQGLHSTALGPRNAQAARDLPIEFQTNVRVDPRTNEKPPGSDMARSCNSVGVGVDVGLMTTSLLLERGRSLLDPLLPFSRPSRRPFLRIQSG
jgi:hypothetical protein